MIIIIVLSIYATHPIIVRNVDVPDNYYATIKSQAKGVCSIQIPLIPAFVSIDDFSEGIAHYTIHYLPFGTVGMTYIENDGYSIEEPLTGL